MRKNTETVVRLLPVKNFTPDLNSMCPSSFPIWWKILKIGPQFQVF